MKLSYTLICEVKKAYRLRIVLSAYLLPGRRGGVGLLIESVVVGLSGVFVMAKHIRVNAYLYTGFAGSFVVGGCYFNAENMVSFSYVLEILPDKYRAFVGLN